MTVIIYMGVARLWFVWMAMLGNLNTVAPAAVRFGTFASTSGLHLVGDTAVAEGKVLRLTPAQQDRSGAAWLIEKQHVASGFDTTFEFQLTRQGGLGRGADGFAFVLQNSSSAALGGRGSAGGFAVAEPSYPRDETGIPWSIAVFFDTFKNEGERDPSANYVAIRTHGKPTEMRWPAERLVFTQNLRAQLKDRKVHTARVLFQPPVLSVFLDGTATPVLETVADLSIVLDPQGCAWVGFTASTGAGYENHDILNWSFTSADVSSNMSVVSSEITFLMSACLPGRNLCTPERAIVEHRGEGYHVILPANLEWGASIPNPHGRKVVIANARGIACWDVKVHGANGCGGPGSARSAGPGFLVPSQGAGSLITKNRDGYTWFSVNGRSQGFKDNEGFYEFDLEIY